jgi:alkylation response protein AidB-like acyl-CoA dehydrogenase
MVAAMPASQPSLSDDLRSRLRAFVEERVIASEDRLEQEALAGEPALMRELQDRAKQEGLWGLGLPRELGGGGLAFLPYALANEIIGRSEFAIEALGTFQTQDVLMLDEFATPEQRARYLEPLARGEILPSIGMTEPEVAGSDPTQVRTTARLEDGHWVIDGHKWFTSQANRAAFTTVMARTDADAEAHRRFSLIIVPTDAPGYEVVRVMETMGDRLGNHCEVRLRGVRVPAANLLGERGDGFLITQRRLAPGRIFHCMRWLGQARRAFELMCERALEREAFGGPLADKGMVQAFIADSAAELQAARLMTLDAARAIDEGRDARIEISLIKFFGARVLHDVIDRAIQVHGALGVTADRPLERMYRSARYARIYDGPDEVHRMVVARRLLKDAARAPWLRDET